MVVSDVVGSLAEVSLLFVVAGTTLVVPVDSVLVGVVVVVVSLGDGALVL